MIHRAAQIGFSRSAEAYERARPGYPDEAIGHLVARLSAGGRVLDLAAGTGKLTRPLVAAGVDVLAVEPVAEMRAALPAWVEAREGTAQAIPLADSSVDAVTVGQAFHWFAEEAALREIHRVLVPGGALALVWNRRVEEDPVNRRITDLLAPYRGDAPTHRFDGWRAVFEQTDLFGALEERVFAHRQVLDADGFEERIGSISFIAALDPETRARVLQRARALAGDGTAVVPYRCEVQTCRAR
jgi:ubiquinone/menaquinone biosynthesis C-methylase UbiE